jgi:hypothetical protein
MKKIFFAFGLLLFMLGSCSKSKEPTLPVPTPTPTPVSTTDSVISVTVDQTKTSYKIPSTFEGLSYEMSELIQDPSFLNANNTTIIQLIKNLGGGLLRIGGNSSDIYTWTGTARGLTTPANSITTTEIDNLSAFAKAVGWQVIFGLNMGVYNPTLAANEANYVFKSLQSNLLALQFGNEPDGYASWNPIRTAPYSESNYETQWNSYFKAVKAQVPAAPLAGPDVAYQSSWVASFAANEGNNVMLLTSHYYQNGPASNPSINISSLFTPIPQYPDYFQVINKAGLSANLPWRITECNSINGGGKAGVSDVFASALWALDFMWQVAENNGQGVNFHGFNGGGYSAFSVVNGVATVAPEYYSFLAFKYGTSGSTIIPAKLSTTQYNCSAYACIKSDTTSITLINKDSTHNLVFKIQLTNKATMAHVARMIAPSISAKTGVTFCNGSVNSNGSFQVGNTENISIGGLTSFSVTVPAASAAVVSVE